MSTQTTTTWDDLILPFQLDRAGVRGRVVRLDETLDSILGQHSYPVPVAALVAEAAVLTALIGQAIKLRWRLSLQVRGDGPIRLITTDYFSPTEEGAPAKIRAWASFDADALTEDKPFSMLGTGYFAILIDQGPGFDPYQGITPLAGTSLAHCAETYFAQSEQLPTRFALGMAETLEPGVAGRWRAGGVMVQHMPKASLHAKGDATGEGGLLAAEDMLDGDDSDNWNRVTILLDTVELTELIGPFVDSDQLLVRLFSEEGPRVFDPQTVRFGCTCGPEKVEQTLSTYSAEEIATMTTDAGVLTADCQFCGAHYEFDPKSLGSGAGV